MVFGLAGMGSVPGEIHNWRTRHWSRGLLGGQRRTLMRCRIRACVHARFKGIAIPLGKERGSVVPTSFAQLDDYRDLLAPGIADLVAFVLHRFRSAACRSSLWRKQSTTWSFTMPTVCMKA